MRGLFALLLTLIWAGLALAQERITNFDVDILVETSGDIEITETIRVVSEGDQIKRGIFRELPARYKFMGVTLDYDYELIEITRDGRRENVTRIENGNALTWRIGNANIFLENGPHTYSIRYRVRDPIRRHRDTDDDYGDRDELWWSPIGTYWNFPIEEGRVTIRFPERADIVDATVVTGNRHNAREDADVQVNGNTVMVRTTRALSPRQGVNTSVSIKPGIIAPISDARKAQIFWIRYGASILLSLGGVLLFVYYWLQWSRVGRDPEKPPVFPRYEPPKDYSPAAVHYIHYKGLRGMEALSALLMQLGTQNILEIEAGKKVTRIQRLSDQVSGADAKSLMQALFPGRKDRLVLDGETNNKFHKAVGEFHQTLAKRYGPKYYKYNLGWGFLGLALSVILVVTVIASPVAKNSPYVIGIFAVIALMNILFFFLLPAPSRYGAQIASEIEGFKLYLETAEEKRLNLADPGSGRAPPMTVELYERFLPYAMALGVEKPWTKQFETSLPREAAEYQPSYAYGNGLGRGRNPVNFSKNFNKTLTAGVAAAAPVSQSSGSGFSSGSGGGGFSGGGGGGGGGGW